MGKDFFVEYIKPDFEEALKFVQSQTQPNWLLHFFEQDLDIDQAYLENLAFSIQAYMVKAIEVGRLFVPFDDLHLASQVALPDSLRKSKTDHANQLLSLLDIILPRMADENDFDANNISQLLSQAISICEKGIFGQKEKISKLLKDASKALTNHHGNGNGNSEDEKGSVDLLTEFNQPETLIKAAKNLCLGQSSVQDHIFSSLIRAGYFTLSTDTNSSSDTMEISMASSMLKEISRMRKNGGLTKETSHIPNYGELMH